MPGKILPKAGCISTEQARDVGRLTGWQKLFLAFQIETLDYGLAQKLSIRLLLNQN
jgi:hypothetical protein